MSIAIPAKELWLPPKPHVWMPSPLDVIKKARKLLSPLVVGYSRASSISEPTLTYIGTTDSGFRSGFTTYTFTSVNIGTAAVDRIVIVVMAANGGQSISQFTSCTIGGNAASLVGAVSATNGEPVAIAYLLVTSGTTADIVVNTSSGKSDFIIGVYTLTGYTSGTPENSGSVEVSGGSAATQTFTPSLGAVGVYITNEHGTDTMSVSWSGGGSITQDAQAVFSGVTSRQYSHGHFTGLSNASGTLTSASLTVTQALAYAEWV